MVSKFITTFGVIIAVMSMSQTTFAAGDAEAGAKVFKKCSACHSLDPSKKKLGPTLKNIIGRPAGSIEGFKYSNSYFDARKKGLVWTEEEIIKYLVNPKKYLATYLGVKRAKSKMTARFKKIKDRENVVAYLKKAAK